mgnify:CR=1 FL=1
MPWLLLLLGMDCAFILLLWLADIQALLALSSAIVLGTIILFSAVLTAVCLRDNRRQKAFLAFLNSPEDYPEQQLLRLSGAAESDMIRLLGAALRQNQQECSAPGIRTLRKIGFRSDKRCLGRTANKFAFALGLHTLRGQAPLR